MHITCANTVVDKWSACSTSILNDPSSNPLKPTVFSVKFVLEKTENKQKEAVVCPFFLKKTRANRRQCESIFQRERLLQFPRERTVF